MNYELVFVTDCHGKKLGNGEVYNGTHKRVISAPTETAARDIGEAMLGEEVYLHEHLQRLVNISPTIAESDLHSFNDQASYVRAAKKLLAAGRQVNLVKANGKITGVAIT